MKFIPFKLFLMPDINDYTDQEHRGELARAGPREAIILIITMSSTFFRLENNHINPISNLHQHQELHKACLHLHNPELYENLQADCNKYSAQKDTHC